MSESLVNACNALDALSAALRDSWGDDRTLQEAYATWNCPPLTRHDMADIPKKLSERMREISPELIDQEFDTKLASIPAKLSIFQSQTLPYLYNGNASVAYPILQGTLAWVRSFVEPLLLPEVDWKDVEEQKLMPRALTRRLRSIDTQITNITSKSANLDEIIQTINDAHAAAEQLPTDMASLEEARKAVSIVLDESGKSAVKVGLSLETATETNAKIAVLEAEAKLLVDKCGAYSAAMTTKGLGEAFSDRADGLKLSMRYWVGGLFVALALGGWLGHERIAVLKDALTTNSGIIWPSIAVSIFAVGAPVWFAWVATKQIGQRFRLAEDYAFKASVAKAYEGYRREAANLDPEFTAQLFGMALTLLQQEPLRLVEKTTHGSPINEVTHGLKNLFQRTEKPIEES